MPNQKYINLEQFIMSEIVLSSAKIEFNSALRLVTISPFEGTTIDAEEYRDQFKAAQQLTNGVPAGVLIKTAPFLNVTKAAREESLKPEHLKYILAQAIVVENLANRIVGNFYIRFHQPSVPTKLFSNQEDALQWLHTKLNSAE